MRIPSSGMCCWASEEEIVERGKEHAKKVKAAKKREAKSTCEVEWEG